MKKQFFTERLFIDKIRQTTFSDGGWDLHTHFVTVGIFHTFKSQNNRGGGQDNYSLNDCFNSPD